MEELLIKNIKEIEFLNIKKVKYDNKDYYIYLDTETQSKVIICDKNQELVDDIKIAKSVLDNTFMPYSNVMHFEEKNNNKEVENDEEEYELSKTEKEKIIKKMKQIFFEKFGEDLLSEKELDYKIRKNIKSIKLSNSDFVLDDDLAGIYDQDEKNITIKRAFNIPTVLFHEFMHGIVIPGAKKVIQFYEDKELEEKYKYGTRIDEGIVSYIQNMRNINRWQKEIGMGSYDDERRIVGLLRTLYKNTEEGKNQDFIKLYVKNPENTLSRINAIFKEDIKNKNPKLNDRQLDLESMRTSLKFVIDMDELEKNKNYADVEKDLLSIYERQIQRKKINSIKELYDVLYEIEGFGINLKNKDERIEKLKHNTITKFLKFRPRTNASNLHNRLPDLKEECEITDEEMLLKAIFGELERAKDIRYIGIKKTLENYTKQKDIEDDGR